MLLAQEQDTEENKKIKQEELEKLSTVIKDGAISFLFEEYIYLTIFIILFGAVVFFFGEVQFKDGRTSFYTTVAFIIGAYTSILCGYIGMMVATGTNAKTAYFAQ
jgi:Na+/H+-translocating membrane pyrophosphatase